MNRTELIDTLQATHQVLATNGFDVAPLVIEPVATEAEVTAIESTLGCSLPASYRNVLLTVSRRVEFSWFTPDDPMFPDPFEDNISGDLHWSLDRTIDLIAEANSWATNVFPNADDEYDAIWHHKVAFYDVGNGDYLALDTTPGQTDEIVYLRHDDSPGHGYVLAHDLADLLDRWVSLACPGGEDTQWLIFTGAGALIDPTTDTARLWRQTLGLTT